MIRLLSKMPLFWSFYFTGWPRALPLSYTFSLTFKCNSRCFTCNIWQKKKFSELSRSEWQRIFRSLGSSPYFVTFSGGEPFLRTDLAEIVKDLYFACRPKIVVIPTNGTLVDKIQKDVRKILNGCPGIRLTINLSLDGVGEEHDKIRGVDGNFEKAMTAFKNLKKIKNKNLNLGVHTVVSKNNIHGFAPLCDFVLDELQPDSYVTEIAENRVELSTMSKNITPSIRDYEKAVDHLEKKIKAKKMVGFPKLTQAFRFFYYKLVVKILERKTQVIPCYAGVASAQVAPNGDIWECCVRADILGNLKEENFNFRKIWFSKKANKIRKLIRGRQCFCPLANASYTNILMNPSSMGKVMVNFLK